MMKNDYRRALILLRCNEPGYSGHVRLERRTLMGSMYFLVQPVKEGETLRALLVGRTRDSYTACLLGTLSRDNRGQAVLSHSFDPRSICGRELEEYQLIAVAATSGNDCRIVLYGNVDGHADLNWERVQQAVCLSLNPAPPQPREEETQMQAELMEAESIPEEIAAEMPAEAEEPVQVAIAPVPAEAEAQTAVETAAELLANNTKLICN